MQQLNQKNMKQDSNHTNNNLEMPIVEHLSELRQRLILSLSCFLVLTLTSSFFLKSIVIILQQPAIGVKFLQLAPGEYFFVTFKIALYTGIILSFPITTYQLVMFILPGLTKKESTIIIPALIGSILLFFTGIIFGYFFLVPAALRFFLNYGSDIIEPLWSFEQYFNFIVILLLSTGLSFQIPILQIVIGFFNLVSSKQMLHYWRYILLISTIIGAILTPSTDPLTQILLSLAIFILYIFGIFVLMIFKK